MFEFTILRKFKYEENTPVSGVSYAGDTLTDARTCIHKVLHLVHTLSGWDRLLQGYVSHLLPVTLQCTDRRLLQFLSIKLGKYKELMNMKRERKRKLGLQLSLKQFLTAIR
jgi:hypothetical protein